MRLCAVETAGDPPFVGVDADLCRQDYAHVPVLRNLRASRSMQALLSSLVPGSALVHVHGVWLMPNVYAGDAADRFKRPLIVSPRGMLAAEALRFSRFRKMAFWKVLQENAYAGAAAWHATCDAEADEIRRFGIRAPIAVIPNGVDVPDHFACTTTDESAPRLGPKTVLFLGRVHPKKGLKYLIDAWASVSALFPDWRLRIIGPDENGHAAELRAQADHARATNVSIEPPLFGLQKTAALAEASVFVLPTLNENFGIAVAEALAASVPSIVTKGAPWSGLETEKCGWWIEHGTQPLAQALHDAMSTKPAELRAMGERGRAWMGRDFSWSKIGHDMMAVYSWINQGGAAPPTVQLA